MSTAPHCPECGPTCPLHGTPETFDRLDPDWRDTALTLEAENATLTDRLESAETRVNRLYGQLDDQAEGLRVACGRFEVAEARVRELTAELEAENRRHNLTNDTLERRSDALNRAGETNDQLRATLARIEKVALTFEQDKWSDWRADDVAKEIRAALDEQEPNA